jgi:hypothetical protein
MQTVILSQRLASSLLLLLLLSLFSCGKQNQLVSQVEVSLSEIDTKVFLSFKAQLNTAGMQAPSVFLPIYHPQNQTYLGEFSLTPMLKSTAQINIDLDLVALAGVSTKISRLPNGARLPLIGDNQVIELNLGNNSQVKLYFSLNPSAEVIGASVAIANFDSIGSRVGTTAIFPVFNVSNVVSSAGIFTSNIKGKNGLAVFTDLSQIISNSVRSKLNSGNKTRSIAQINYQEQSASQSKQKVVDTELYRLHARKAHLVIAD